ncbi:thiol oxidoreductase [Gammaproteobacteria bacterium 45_16_T64]|nr:thiol oxidoreductase [Gammaproteobacteria bacterium 45_16_T64]
MACGSGGGGGSTTRDQGPQIEHLAGGDATVNHSNPSAFSQHSANMTDAERIRKFNNGDDFFENPWVAKTASTENRDGLGPLFNNNACQDCHIRDGRGHAPAVSDTEDGTNFSSMLIRASRSIISDADLLAMQNGTKANVGDSSVGGQLQQDAIYSITKEANLRVSYSPITVTFNDGFEVILRKPEWHLTSNYANQGYDFDADTVFSARVAPPMIGLGLLALISDADMLANEDINDTDQNGISGKANRVQNHVSQQVELGRFGWKAGQPTLRQQAAGAFLGDMGLTSEIFSTENCLMHQDDCSSSPNGNGDSTEDYDFEVNTLVLDNIEIYSHNLAVPVRRDAYSNSVQQGKALFIEAGCTSCHVESYQTTTSTDHPELSDQTIFPYTDLLLHDMGEDLADFTVDNDSVSAAVLVEYQASAQEWRTPALWGLGLTHTVDPEATLLHDGRAQTIMEAILWHGGEALNAKNAVLDFDSNERDALISFLSDL